MRFVDEADQAEWTRTLDQRGSVTFPVDRRTVGKLLVACVVLAALGIGLILLRGPVWWDAVGAAELAIVTALATVLLHRLLTGEPVLVADADGLRWGRRVLAWSEIEDVRTFNGTLTVVEQTEQAATRNRGVGGPTAAAYSRWRERTIGRNTVLLPPNNGYDPIAMADWVNSVREPRH